MRFQFAALQFEKELSEIECQTAQIKLRRDIYFAPHEDTSELVVTFENPESPFYLNGTVHPMHRMPFTTQPSMSVIGILPLPNTLSPGIKQKVFSGEIKFTNEEMSKLVQSSPAKRKDVFAEIIHPEITKAMEAANADPKADKPVPMPTSNPEQFKGYFIIVRPFCLTALLQL